ncbi:MAG: PEP/pyruvate-binding domain-containing protein, partial [Myxococcota bacterium]
MPIRNPLDTFRSEPRTPEPSTAAPSPKTAEQVPLASPQAPEAETRAAVARESVARLTDVIDRHKEVTGNAMASRGKGDPRITERRSAVSTLVAAKAGVVDLDNLMALSQAVKEDVEWLRSADRTDYQRDVAAPVRDWGAATPDNPFSWTQSDMSRPNALLKEFTDRRDTGIKQAQELESGARSYFPIERGSLIGLSYLTQPARRADALADALLQLRARTDLEQQVNPDVYPSKVRIDKVGPAIVAEQRVVLKEAKLSIDNPDQLREFALLKQVIASHPLSTANGIFEARNAVGGIFHTENSDNYSARDHATAWVMTETPPGASAPPYRAIHHNYSKDTPRNIRATIDEWIFPVGPKELRGETFGLLTDALQTARQGDVAAARELLAAAAEKNPGGVGDLKAQLAATPDSELADGLRNALVATLQKSVGTEPANQEKNLLLFARLFRSVCETRPTARSLQNELFHAGDAWPEVADVITQLGRDNGPGTLKELGEARVAMRDAILAAPTGYERNDLILFDAKLERLTTEELGAAVERVGDLSTDAQKSEALLAVQTALRAGVASGLHAIKDPADPAAKKGESLDVVLADIDAAMAKGSIGEDAYRTLMSRVYVSVARSVQNIRSFIDRRAADVAAGGAELDPQFLDQLVKQTPLHYATALAQKGMRAGLKEVIEPRHIQNPTGLRVLNSIGPVVFDSVVFAQNTKELVAKKPEKDALSVLWELSEKKMVAVGGLIVDTQHAPGGNSHLNMYAMNNGIAVLALPELREKYSAFLEQAAKEGGVYVDDRNGEFHMMTVEYALEQGALTRDKLEELRPGTNRRISYLKSNASGDGFDVIAKHEAVISPERKTREVELYVPLDEVKGIGRGVTSFADLAKLGVHGRHLAGEKGLVLALMKADPTIGPYVPDGSVITTGRVNGLLHDAGILEEWNKPWAADPKVGRVDDNNFLQSAFYTDAGYRAQVRSHLQETTLHKLTEHLIHKNADGSLVPSPAGQAFYEELLQNPALGDSLIFRSSYTGEDRPGKSGAGQYESYVDKSVAKKLYGKERVEEMFTKLEAAKQAVSSAEATVSTASDGDKAAAEQTLATAREQLAAARRDHNAFMAVPRLQAAIGVIESAWMPEPVENNVADEVNLQHIMCSCTVQNCIDPQVSGVMISRDIEHGTRGQVSYQLVKGFGGGVDGGKTEEGLITASGHSVKMHYPGEPDGLTSANALKELRQVVLSVEKFFHDVMEPGKGYAVDMEVCREDEQWKVVQARVILMERVRQTKPLLAPRGK